MRDSLAQARIRSELWRAYAMTRQRGSAAVPAGAPAERGRALRTLPASARYQAHRAFGRALASRLASTSHVSRFRACPQRCALRDRETSRAGVGAENCR